MVQPRSETPLPRNGPPCLSSPGIGRILERINVALQPSPSATRSVSISKRLIRVIRASESRYLLGVWFASLGLGARGWTLFLLPSVVKSARLPETRSLGAYQAYQAYPLSSLLFSKYKYKNRIEDRTVRFRTRQIWYAAETRAKTAYHPSLPTVSLASPSASP